MVEKYRRHRSAVTGRMVSREFAGTHPNTTVSKKADKPLPAVHYVLPDDRPGSCVPAEIVGAGNDGAVLKVGDKKVSAFYSDAKALGSWHWEDICGS